MKDTVYKESRPAKIKVFLDTNILLDYLNFRSEEALAVEYIIDLCMRGTVECCAAAHSLTDIFYILRKDYSESDRIGIVLSLCDICQIQEISRQTIERAARSAYSDDLEDALQMQCAEDSNCDYLLTRDLRGFSRSPVRAMLPHDFVRELKL